jgi:hypothetical protein
MNSTLLKDVMALLEAEVGRVGASARRGVLQGAVGMTACGVTVIGVLLIALGLFLHLSESDGPLVAGLWVGGGLIAGSALVATVAMSLAGRRAKRRAEADAAIARSIARADLAELTAVLKTGSPGIVVLAGAALLAGIMTGRRGD